MSENEADNNPKDRLEGEHLTGGPSLKQWLLIIGVVMTVLIGAGTAVYFKFGGSFQHNGQYYVKLARQSLSRGKLDEAIIHFRNAVKADPNSAETFQEMGMAYLRLGNPHDALTQFLRAIQINPKLISARYQLGRLLAAGKALAQADEQLLAIREINPNAVENTLLAADIAVSEGSLDRALTILNNAAQRDPKKVFYLNAGALYLRKKDYQGAEQAYVKVIELDPNSYYARTAMAAVYLAQGKSDKAEQELIAATNADPENEEMVKVLGNFYSVTHQMDRLEKLYRGLVTKKPDSLIAKKVLGELSLRKGDFKEAKVWADAILKEQTGDIDGRYFRGRILLAERDFVVASQQFLSVIADSPKYTPAFYYLGLAKLGTGNVDDARDALTKAVELAPAWIMPRLDLAGLYVKSGDHRLALQESQAVLDIYPNDRSALYVTAGALYAKGDYERALEVFKRIQKFFPGDPTAHTGLAGVYMAQFKFAPALAEYEEALRIDPNRLDALNSIAQLLIKQGKAKEALERVEQHRTKTKDTAGIYQIIGQLNLSSGDYDKGIEYLEKAVEANPNLVSAYLLIGNAHAKRKNFDAAIAQYQKAIQRNPKAIAPQMLIATMYDGKKNYAKANEYYEKILEKNLYFAPAANNLAWNIIQLGGNLDIALRWGEKARENDPYNPIIADTLGWIIYHRGSYGKAVELLKESSERLGNKNPAVMYHLGMAYYKLGKRDQAREWLKKALTTSKDFSGVTEASRTLSVLGEG